MGASGEVIIKEGRERERENSIWDWNTMYVVDGHGPGFLVGMVICCRCCLPACTFLRFGKQSTELP